MSARKTQTNLNDFLGVEEKTDSSKPNCNGHAMPCVLRVVVKDTPNKGRKFWSCPVPPPRSCKTFQWAPSHLDPDVVNGRTPTKSPINKSPSKGKQQTITNMAKKHAEKLSLSSSSTKKRLRFPPLNATNNSNNNGTENKLEAKVSPYFSNNDVSMSLSLSKKKKTTLPRPQSAKEMEQYLRKQRERKEAIERRKSLSSPTTTTTPTPLTTPNKNKPKMKQQQLHLKKQKPSFTSISNTSPDFSKKKKHSLSSLSSLSSSPFPKSQQQLQQFSQPQPTTWEQHLQQQQQQQQQQHSQISQQQQQPWSPQQQQQQPWSPQRSQQQQTNSQTWSNQQQTQPQQQDSSQQHQHSQISQQQLQQPPQTQNRKQQFPQKAQKQTQNQSKLRAKRKEMTTTTTATKTTAPAKKKAKGDVQPSIRGWSPSSEKKADGKEKSQKPVSAGGASPYLPDDHIIDSNSPDSREFHWIRNPKDAKKRPKGHPDYDPSTIFISSSDFARFTEAQQQYWKVKSKHWDSVVFFRLGNFYELYGKDADLGTKLFDFKLVVKPSQGWNFRQAGVPVGSIDIWVAKFVALGYKVVIVDEVETRVGANMRKKKASKNYKERNALKSVIERKITKILTKGTLVDEEMMRDHSSLYLLSVVERMEVPPDATWDAPKVPHFGVCFIDTASGDVHIGEFYDTNNRSSFETLLLRIKPAEVIYERGKWSKETELMIKSTIGGSVLNPRITPPKQKSPWTFDACLSVLQERQYFHPHFGQKGSQLNFDPQNSTEHWPDELKQIMDSNATIGLAALGGSIEYLHHLKLASEVFSMKKFHIYHADGSGVMRNYLVLDGKALINLEIFENNSNGGREGTLFGVLEHCCTSFGKRLLRRWVCMPLFAINEINERLDAVDDLNSNLIDTTAISDMLSGVCDLERALSSIHAGRAKIKQFVEVLQSFQTIWEIICTYFPLNTISSLKSPLLKRIVSVGEEFPDIRTTLSYFKEAFDWDHGMAANELIPRPGTNKGYDAAQGGVTEITNELEEYLNNKRGELGIEELVYTEVGKSRYIIGIDNKYVSSIQIPSEFEPLRHTSKQNRYTSPAIKQMLERLEEAEEFLSNYRKGLLRQYLKQMDKHYFLWAAVVRCTAQLDCLLSLSKASLGTSAASGEMCRPVFLPSDPSSSNPSQSNPFLTVTDLRHPCVVLEPGKTFIPNDVTVGGEGKASVLLVTGPNMGGKSTILRQVCIGAIMAQIGCFVPASSFVMSPADRIYTRIGANDDIIGGRSTFMVELQETANILHNTTEKSLVILDELGRGTSTFDGYSIAYAVLEWISKKIRCRTLFSTHYHLLTKEFKSNPNIDLYHMSCYVDEVRKDVTFLYKFMPGVCPKSYGMNVAKAAGVEQWVVDRAAAIANLFDKSVAGLANFKEIVQELALDTDFQEMETEEEEWYRDEEEVVLSEQQQQIFRDILVALNSNQSNPLMCYASLVPLWSQLKQPMS